jgi:hypothetical protein
MEGDVQWAVNFSRKGGKKGIEMMGKKIFLSSKEGGKK